MGILADVAPTWAIADLIDLLADSDPDVRYLAAKGLQRLTAQTQGRDAEQWRQPLLECSDTHARWQAWWQANRDRFAARTQ